MFHRPIRLAALALLVFALAGCSGGGEPTAPAPTPPPAPTPTAAIALSSTTASITAGGTLAVSVTITRGGGFTGDVTVTATGLPTGVNAGSTTIASGSTSGTLTFTALASAPAATATPISITASGTGVTIAAQPLALTVVGGNGAVIALSANAGSIEAGRASSIIVTVTRTGSFTGTVNVAVTGLPTGVTAVNQTLAAGVTTDTIPLSSNLGAAAGTTTLTISGTGSGITIAPQTYALTTTLGPITPLGNDMTSGDGFYGSAMALNADGTRIVVGAYASANGTTRVYERTGTTWTQMGADIVGEAAGDRAGLTVAINAAGTRIAVGAYLNDGNFTNAGHVRVFDFVGGTWTQVGADIDGGEGINRGFGTRVALSGTGNRLVASASDVGGGSGSVKVYDLVSGTWTQVGTTVTGNNEFGYGLDVSSDGTTFAVGATSGGGSSRAGSVQVYRLSGTAWTQVGNTLVGEQIGDGFGSGVSLSATGSRIVVGAPNDREGDPSGGNTPGKVRVFDLIGATWTQVGGDILGGFGVNGDGLGTSAEISDDGTRFAASGPSQNLTRVYTFAAGLWVQTGPVIGGYGTAGRPEGLALSADGRTVAAGYVNGVPRIARVFRITP